MTLEDGLIITWRLPLFSALYMLFKASFKTLTLTMITETKFQFKCQSIVTSDLNRSGEEIREDRSYQLRREGLGRLRRRFTARNSEEREGVKSRLNLQVSRDFNIFRV